MYLSSAKKSVVFKKISLKPVFSFSSALAAALALNSCASLKTDVAPEREVLLAPPVALSADLEQLLAQKSFSIPMQLSNSKLAMRPLSDEQKSQLRNYFLNVAKGSANTDDSVSYQKKSAKSILDSLKHSDFMDLKDVSLDQVIRATDRLPDATALSLAQSLVQDARCYPAQVNLAFATWSERDFPEPSAITRATTLYEKAYNCGQGEIKARAAYRLGLFAQSQNNCELSQKYWETVMSTDEVKFLFSRAQYWKNRCLEVSLEKENKRTVAMDFYNQYPLTYHTIQAFKENDQDLSAMVMARTHTPVQLRTQRSSEVNLLVAQAERALAAGQYAEARDYLSWIPDGVERHLEPYFRLYLGYLDYRLQDGLSAFQTLAKVFSVYPELKSRSTLQLFYPRWYYSEIEKEAVKNKIDPLLVISLVRQESAFNQNAISRVGARGLMQLMPTTARHLVRGLNKKHLLDPKKNIKAGTLYFAQLLKRYNGDAGLALAAYNAGYGAVDKWVSRYKVNDALLFVDLIPYRETREYVASILRNYYWYQTLENKIYGPHKVILGEMNFLDLPAVLYASPSGDEDFYIER